MEGEYTYLYMYIHLPNMRVLILEVFARVVTVYSELTHPFPGDVNYSAAEIATILP